MIAMTDPMELIVRGALERAGIDFTTDRGGGNQHNLDFYLPDFDLYIEVKQFHAPRIAEQMSRAENIIVAQGKGAVTWLASLIDPNGTSAQAPDGNL